MNLLKIIAVIIATGVVSTPVAFSHSDTVHNLHELEAIVNRNSTQNKISSHTWISHIAIGGIMSVDVVEEQRGWNITGPFTAGIIPNFQLTGIHVKHVTDVTVNNASLLLDACINRWMKAHLGAIYRDIPGPIHAISGVDEAYITIGDLKRLPFYWRIGREYIPIGSYEDPYPLTMGIVQLLTQTNATIVQLGYASLNHNIYGMIYSFNSPFSSHVIFHQGSMASYGVGEFVHLPRATRVRNFGAKLGYKSNYRGMHYNLEASYLKDFRDTDFFLANEFNPIAAQPAFVSELQRAAIYELHAYVMRGPFDFLADYTALTRRIDESFPAKDFKRNTRMWAYSVRGGYWFDTRGHRSKLQVAYERAGHTVLTPSFANAGGVSRLNPARYTPRFRYIIDYIINIRRYTSLTLQYTYARDFRGLVSGSILPPPEPNDDLAERLSRNSASTLKARLTVAF